MNARHLVHATLSLLVAFSAAGGDAALCELTGAAAPAVPTLIASPVNVSEAWIVSPDCSVVVQPTRITDEATTKYTAPLTPKGLVALTIGTTIIERIESVPASLQSLEFKGPAKLASVNLTNAKDLQYVYLMQSSLESTEVIALPDSVLALNLAENSLTTVKNMEMPSKLVQLFLDNNLLESVDFAIPGTIKALGLSGNPITKLERIVFPEPLLSLTLEGTLITTIRGCQFPSTLAAISFGATPIKEFELRQSDFDALTIRQTSMYANVWQTTCSDSTAELLTLSSLSVCVISDARFLEKYSGPVTEDESGSSSSGNGGSSHSGSGVIDVSISTSSRGEATESSPSSTTTTAKGKTSTPSTIKPTGSSQKLLQDENPGSSSSSAGNAGSLVNASTSTTLAGPSTSSSSAGESPVAADPTSSSSSSTISAAIASGGAAVVLLLAIVGYRLRAAAKKSAKSSDGSSDTSFAELRTTPTSIPSEDSRDYLVNDVRNDPLLLPLRLDFGEITLGAILTRGNTSVIYRGIYRQNNVVIKRLEDSVSQDDTVRCRFMDEIRMCAGLEHEKITGFRGMAWTGAHDLSVVGEFMAGGDLATLLHDQPGPDERHWREPWSPIGIKSKTAIAQDAAEAVVYLHSFRNPILHRDLQACNVLLDDQGNAKLNGFSISREMPLGETMTRGVGTFGWIAPEVLRGERYSEKADIYSLGVLLVEMDKCHHPYADTTLTNTQIAELVSKGELRPTTSSECPPSIRELIDQCTSFDAEGRPTAMELVYRLRQIHRKF